MPYLFLEHTADVKFRATGENLEEMFVSSAEALNEVIRGNITILEQKEISFSVEGHDVENLLYNFLEEFLYLLDAKNFLVSKIKFIQIKNKKLECTVAGDSADNYAFTNDVKAVTYNEMFVREENGKFKCQVVLDV